MAKYGRYDPRNKKYGRNKTHSLDKNNRIREVTSEKPKYDKIVDTKLTHVYIDEDDLYDEEH